MVVTMGQQFDVAVLGAGIIGTSVAATLQMRGRHTALVDRLAPGMGTSFGNAGLIQNEAVMPYLFPRAIGDLLRYARNRSIDASYQPAGLPALAGPFLRYWHNSRADRAMAIAHARAPLFARSIADHCELAKAAGALDLLKPTGWSKVFYTQGLFDRAIADAELAARELGVPFVPMDARSLAAHEPHLSHDLIGGIHWPEPRSVADPLALTQAYVDLFTGKGGTVLTGDARSLERGATGLHLVTQSGPITARAIVVALGPWSPVVTNTLGYRAPYFVKRGYHRHFAATAGGLTRPILDAENGYILAPMRHGIRLTTGAEFADRDAPARPVQIARALPKARHLFPTLGDTVDPEAWLGSRPCLPDMLPVIGPAPGQPDAWFAFGHAHHGLTLGPTTGRMIADMIDGHAPEIDPTPYRADRFQA